MRRFVCTFSLCGCAGQGVADKMTLDAVRAEVELIRANQQDPEMQSAIKKMLYIRVLTEIANRNYHDSWDLAREALEAEKVPIKWSAHG